MEKYTPPPFPAKAKFGLQQAAKHAPKWLVPAFSIAILVIGTIQFMISGDPAIPDDFKLRINHYLTGLGMFLGALAPFFGINIRK